MDETRAAIVDRPVDDIAHLPSSCSVDEVRAALVEHGAVIVDELFAPTQRERVYTDIRPYLDEAAPAGGDFFGHATKGIPGALAKAPSFATFIEHPLLLGAADAVLLPDARTYQ